MRARLIRMADDIAHLPIVCRVLPGFVRNWLCDRMDLAMGATPDDLANASRRTAR
jgi:hypothetical protein